MFRSPFRPDRVQRRIDKTLRIGGNVQAHGGIVETYSYRTESLENTKKDQCSRSPSRTEWREERQNGAYAHAATEQEFATIRRR